MKDIPTPQSDTSLDIFEKPGVLVNYSGSNVQTIYPRTSTNSPNLEFCFKTDNNVFLDMQSIKLLLSARIMKDNGGSKITHTTTGGHTKDDVCFVNNTLHSLFSNCEVTFNGETVSSANNLYAHRAFIEAETSHNEAYKESTLYCQGYTYEDNPGKTTDKVFTNRKELVKKSEEITFFGRLSVDLFACDKLLIPGVDVRITLTRSSASFCLIGDDTTKNYTVEINKAVLKMREMIVDKSVFDKIQSQITKEPAVYPFTEIKAKTYIIQDGQNEFFVEDIFNQEPIRRLCIALNTNEKFTGTLKENPFHFEKHKLKRVLISRNSIPLVDISTSSNVEPYFGTLESLHFTDSGPAITLKDYSHHFFLVFDLTAPLSSNTEVYFPELIGGSLRLQLYFSTPADTPLELLLLGEKLSTVSIFNKQVIKT